MTDTRPGLNHPRLVRLMRESIERCGLNLNGLTVLTEAASGAYAVTPVLAAMSGAHKVLAVTRSSRYGTAAQIAGNTFALAAEAGVDSTIEIHEAKMPELVAIADIVTNSGHVRPLDRGTVAQMKSGAVIPLMYEAWEYRGSDLDLQACRELGILVGGTNERHPAIDVFSFLGVMAIRLLTDAGISVHSSQLLLLCDNPFLPYIENGLRNAGASVDSFPRLPESLGVRAYDAIVVAMTPRGVPVLSPSELRTIAAHSHGTVIAQYWGDLDSDAVREAGLTVWPDSPPPSGHMGILPAAIGPEATVRLQAGGLKAGEVLFRRSFLHNASEASFVELM